MNEASSGSNKGPSEYDSDDAHRPLLDLQFEAKVWRYVLAIIIFAGLITWVLISSGHGWWAGAVVLFAVLCSIGTVQKYRFDRVRVFRDGVLATYMTGFQTGDPYWRQFPWSAILHLDFSNGNLQIVTAKDSSSYGEVFSYLGKMDRKEKAKLVNHIKSLQQRGDIPAMVRIVE